MPERMTKPPKRPRPKVASVPSMGFDESSAVNASSTTPAVPKGRMAMLLDYQWCSGCLTCEVACQMEHGFKDDRSGIKLTTIGPWDLNGSWQYDNVIHLTDLCDFCYERTAAGKLPACVQHCQAQVLKIGDVSELAVEVANGPKKILIVP